MSPLLQPAKSIQLVVIGTTSPSKKLVVNGTTEGITFEPNVASPVINTTSSASTEKNFFFPICAHFIRQITAISQLPALAAQLL